MYLIPNETPDTNTKINDRKSKKVTDNAKIKWKKKQNNFKNHLEPCSRWIKNLLWSSRTRLYCHKVLPNIYLAIEAAQDLILNSLRKWFKRITIFFCHKITSKMSAQRAQETNIANHTISFSIISTGLLRIIRLKIHPSYRSLHTWNNCEFIVAF